MPHARDSGLSGQEAEDGRDGRDAEWRTVVERAGDASTWTLAMGDLDSMDLLGRFVHLGSSATYAEAWEDPKT